MTHPVTVTPGPSQRPNETPLIAPAPEPPPPSAPHPPPDVVARSLRYSIKDASAWAVMQGAGISYVTPFVVLGGKGLFYIAALAALPALAGGLVQWWGAHLTDRFGQRNRIIVWCSLAQGLFWIPIAGAIFLPLNVGYWIMLAAFLMVVVLGNIIVPAWQSLMGDLVPAEGRGRYFGARNAISGLVQVGAFFGAGWFITLAEQNQHFERLGLSGREFGFLLLFVLACAARCLSAWYLNHIHEPPYHRSPGDHFTLMQFIRRAPKAHFGRFVMYSSLMSVGFGLVGPFLAWHLLHDLEFSAGTYATIVTVSMLCSFLSQPLWGRLVDRLGSKRILGIGGIAVTFIPALYLLCSESWHFLIVMVYDGIAGAAYSIALGNYFFDVVTPPKRARCVAFNTLFVAIGGAVGAFAAAAIGEWFTTPTAIAGWSIPFDFTILLLVSIVVRAIANLALLGTFAEFRLQRPDFGAAATPPAA